MLKGLQNKILCLCHGHQKAAHLGSERTYKRFQEKYFQPHALSGVDKFMKSCEKCNQFNPPHSNYIKAPLQLIRSKQRFELVCYDIAGPFLPVTIRGNRDALIIVDHYYTHWPKFVNFIVKIHNQKLIQDNTMHKQIQVSFRNNERIH